jgi:dihydroflavonol-4-reductase
MGITLVTGATGFVGSHVARALVRRGDAVRVTVRDGSPEEALAGLDVERARADLLDRRAVRRALRGVDRVFHVAGLSSLRASAARLHEVNVVATRIVLEEALRAGVERAVQTSSVAAVGPAPRGQTADEAQPFPPEGHAIPYVHTKHEAEVEALRIGARGLPLVIVCPAHVLGVGDLRRSSTELVRRFLLRRIPAWVDGALNVVDAEDVARGHVLADERGRIGERYILGGRNFTLDRLFADLGRLSGVEPPAIKLPLATAIALAEAAERMPGRSVVTVAEIRAASAWWAFRSTKARRELDWRATPHDDTLEKTIAWYREREGDRLRRTGTRQPVGLRVAGFAARSAGALAERLGLG